MILLVDRAAPNWVVTRVADAIPAKSRYYSAHVWPVAQPVVMLWTTPEYASYSGDHLDASITIGLFGSGWKTPDNSRADVLLHFISHELFHNWDAGTSFTDQESTGTLASEGGADAASAIASAAAAHQPTETAWLRSVENAYNACVVKLSGSTKSLASRLHEGAPGRLPYDCGQTILFVLAAASPAHDPVATYFATWRHLHTIAPDRSYTWRNLVPEDANQKTVVALARAINTPGGFASAASAAFEADGYRIIPEATPNLAERSAAAGQLMVWAMAGDCAGQTGFWTQPDRFLLDKAVTQCATLHVGGKVTGMQDHKLLGDPWALAAIVHKRCAAHLPIRIEYANNLPPTTLQCHDTPPDIERPVRIVPPSSAKPVGAPGKAHQPLT